jgi:hypothetical protein
LKVYVVVETYGLIVQGIFVTTDLDKAKERFKNITGLDYDKHDPEELGDYDQTKIFETTVDGICPKCGQIFDVAAVARDYIIKGCPEHREFDRVIWK